MDELELTILMPCLNEEKAIEYCINEAKRFLQNANVSAEILIADNGSDDSSVQLAEQLGARVISVTQKGYGNALRSGIAAARGKYIIMGDADGSYDFVHLDAFLQALRQGYDLVMGNRFAGGISPGAMKFTHRYIGIPFLSWFGRICYHTKVTDFHCGLRGFQRDAAMELDLQAEGMEFASEIIGEFAKHKKSIIELPTVLRKDIRGGKSHLRTVKDGLRHMKWIWTTRARG